MKYGIISFSAPGSTQKKNCHLSSNRQSLLRSLRLHLTRHGWLFSRVVVHDAALHIPGEGGFGHPGMEQLEASGGWFPPIDWAGVSEICLGYLQRFKNLKMKESRLKIYNLHHSMQFFHILPPKITQKFQLLRLATSKTPHGTPRVFVTTVPSSPPPKWSPVSQLSLPYPGWEQSALPTGSATSQRWVGIGDTACHMTKMPFQRQDTAGMYSPRCDI